MKQIELVDKILAGAFVAAGEYRGGKAEKIAWRDEKTGKRLEAIAVRHVVEIGPETVMVQERTSDDYKLEDFRPKFPKGTRVVLELASLSVIRGVKQASGVLHEMEAD